MPKVTDSGQAGPGPRSRPSVHPGPAASARREDVPSAAVCTQQEQRSALSLLQARPPLPPPGPSRLRAPDTLGVGLAQRGEKGGWGKKTEQETQRPGRWETKKKRGGRGCLHTRYIFLHTLVHTPRYSTCKNICYSHSRLLPGAPRASGGAGGHG